VLAKSIRPNNAVTHRAGRRIVETNVCRPVRVLRNPLNANGTRNSGTTAGLSLLARAIRRRSTTHPVLPDQRPPVRQDQDQSLSLAVAATAARPHPPAPVTTGSPVPCWCAWQRRLAHARASIVERKRARPPRAFGLCADRRRRQVRQAPRVQSEIVMPRADHHVRSTFGQGATALRSSTGSEPVGNSIAATACSPTSASMRTTAFDRPFSTASTARCQSGYVNSVIAGQTLTVSDPFKG